MLFSKSYQMKDLKNNLLLSFRVIVPFYLSRNLF